MSNPIIGKRQAEGLLSLAVAEIARQIEARLESEVNAARQENDPIADMPDAWRFLATAEERRLLDAFHLVETFKAAATFPRPGE